MNKIICNTVDFILSNEIERMTGTNVVLVDGAVWHRLEATEKPVYSSDIRRQDAGPTNEETVSVQTRCDAAPILRTHAAFYYVLRLQTDTETFYAGTPAFPATVEITSDRLFDNISFKAVSCGERI
jgi:hypothetical protein